SCGCVRTNPISSTSVLTTSKEKLRERTSIGDFGLPFSSGTNISVERMYCPPPSNNMGKRNTALCSPPASRSSCTGSEKKRQIDAPSELKMKKQNIIFSEIEMLA